MEAAEDLDALARQLTHHEVKSQQRYELLCEKLKGMENKPMEGINSDKVNINLGGGESGGGGSMAAVIAALGNRNQGNDNAALIAALSNRNDRNDNDGMNSLWPLLLLGRRGFGGGDDCGGGRDRDEISPAQAALLQNILENGAALRAAVPATALETQNAIQGNLGALALGIQQGFANNKDAIQASLLGVLTAVAGNKDAIQTAFTVLNQNILDQGCKGREATQAGTTAVLQKLDQNEIDRLRHERDAALRSVEVNALRSQVEVNQTVTTTQTQAQAQGQVQAQFQSLASELRSLRCELSENTQFSKASAMNSNYIIGNTGASTVAAQTATPTSTNVR